MKLRIEFRDAPVRTPISPSVHKGEAGKPWAGSQRFKPPFPPRHPVKGYPIWILSFRGRELEFASPEEIDHAIEVLSQKVLPRPWQLAHGTLQSGRANQHWLSRLHKSWTPWEVRQALVKRLKSLKEI